MSFLVPFLVQVKSIKKVCHFYMTATFLLKNGFRTCAANSPNRKFKQ